MVGKGEVTNHDEYARLKKIQVFFAPSFLDPEEPKALHGKAARGVGELLEMRWPTQTRRMLFVRSFSPPGPAPWSEKWGCARRASFDEHAGYFALSGAR